MYSVNWRRFAIGLLPLAMRGSVKELCSVLTEPVRVLHHRFTVLREDGTWRLDYNCCTGSLQAMLNDRYSDVLQQVGRPILIEDGAAVRELMVYRNSDYRPLMVGCHTVLSHTEWSAAPFLVKVPVELENNTNLILRIEAYVKQYKMAGTKYVIEFY